MASAGIPAIVLEGQMLDKWMQHSELIRMLAEISPGRIELTKPTGLSNQEWDTLTLLLEPRVRSGPLIVRSQGRSVVNPLHNITKDSIQNMIRYLMIDNEATFRRLAGAETKAPVYSSSSSSSARERNRYSFNSNNGGNFGNGRSMNNNNYEPESNKPQFNNDVLINNENNWYSYQEMKKKGPLRPKRGGTRRRATRRGRRSTRRQVTRRN